ncbi:SGNH/GDSL hydrolase family protein [Mycoplasmopsis columboralis]|uniref:SGNH/GDSL hydrolase family protein n=1 Tax=Mycoplasmopsis columboralis TaxID=171282 RepID=UPI00056AB541|nr:GDSL-type esterase/lipase family protein [Mycoplasmopsis columboralis]
MSKRKSLVMSLALLSVSGAYVASCNAPGSSTPIQKEDPQIDLLPPIENVNVAKPTTDLGNNVNDKNKPETTVSLFGNPVEANAPKSASKNYISAEQKINYVAFGDSITAGFDGTLPTDFQGEKLSNGTITGLSYPAFLARMLNNNNRVAEFKNFAYSGSTALDWLTFLGVDYQPASKTNRFAKKYKENYETVLNDFKNRLAKANLVTFSIGANDLFQLITSNIKNYNLSDVFKTLTSANPSYGELAKFVNDVLGKSLTEMSKRINTLISTIKVLAPHANINLISYPVPMLGLKELFDDYLKSLFNNLPLNIKPLDYLLGVLNSALKSTAKITSINYVNLYNEDFWSKNANSLSTILLDIHPNTFGYKKMAQDLYLKLSVDKLGIQNYGNYDFNEEFLNSDSDSLELQIQPTQDSTKIFGNTSFEYINSLSEQEKQIQSLRSERNFGQRIIDLTNIFEDLLYSGINTLTKQNFYKELDPQGVLTQLLFSEDKKEIFGDFNEKFQASGIIQDGFYNLQSTLRELKNKNQLTLQQLGPVALSAFLNESNIAKLVGVIARSNLIKNNKEQLTELLNTILTNGLNIYKDKIINSLASIISQFTKNKLNQEAIKTLLNKILSDENFENILHTISNIFINRSENFENVQNYKDIILAFLQNTEDFDAIANSLSAIAGYVLETPEIQDLIADILYEYLKNNDLHANITSEQTTKFTKDLLTFASDSLLRDGLLKDLIKGVLNNLNANPSTDLSSVLTSSLANVFGSFFDFNNNNERLIAFLKNLFASEIIKGNKEFLKSLVNNILNSQKISLPSFILDLIPSPISAQIREYVGKDNFKDLLGFVLELPQTKDTINTIVGSLVDNSAQFSEFETFEELIQKLLRSINLDTIKENLKAIINSVLSSEKFAAIVEKVLLNAFEKINVDVTKNTIKNFAKSAANSLDDIINYLGVHNQIIDVIFEKLQLAQTQDNSIEILSTIPASILEIFSHKVNDNVYEFIKGLINLDLIQQPDNRAALKEILSALWDHLNADDTLASLAKNVLNKAIGTETIETYFDVNELNSFIDSFIKQSSLKDLLINSFDFVISHQVWKGEVNNFEDFLVTILKDPQLQSTLQNTLSIFIDQSIDNAHFSKTFAKLVNALLAKYDVTLDTVSLEELGSQLPGFVKEIIGNNNLKDRWLELLFTDVQSSNSLPEVLNNLKNATLKALDITNSPLLINSILNSALIKDHKDTLKNLFESFVTQLQNSSKLNVFVQDLKLHNVLASLNVQDQEVQTLFASIFADPNFVTVSKTAFNLILDHAKEIATSQTYNEFLDKLTENKDEILALKEPLKALVSNLLSNSTVKRLIAQSVHSYLVKAHLDTKLTQEQTDQAVSDLLLFVGNNPLVSEFINNFIEDALTNIHVAGASQFGEIIIRSLTHAAENTFEFSTDEDALKLVQLINNVIDSNFLNNNKSYLKTLLTNIIEKLADLDVASIIFNFLPQTSKEFIEQSITKEKFNSLVNLILSLDDTKVILKTVVNNILDSSVSLRDSQSLNDLISKIVKIIDFNAIKSPSKSLLESLIAQQQFKPLLKSVFTSVYQYLNLDPTSEHNAKFIEDLSNNLKATIDAFELLDPIFEKVFEKLSQAATSDRPLDILKELPNDLGTIFAAKVSSDPQAFIKKVFNLDVFANNKEALSDLIKAIYGILEKNDILDSIIKNTIIPQLLKEPASLYVDAEEIGDLLLNIVKSNNFKAFVFDAIDLLIHNSNWVDHLNDPKALINEILKIDTFAERLQDNIAPLLKEILQENKLRKTLAKVAHKLATDNGYEFDLNKLTVVSRNLLNSIIPYLESIGSLDKLVNNVFALINQHKDIDLIAQNISSAITKSFDFSDFNLIKHLLASELFTENIDVLKEVALSFINQFTTKDHYSNLVAKVDLTNALTSANLNSTQITQLNDFVKETLKDTKTIELFKKALEFVIDNALELSKSQNYSDLAFKILKDEHFITSIKTNIIYLVDKVLKNPALQEILGTLIYNYVSNSNYSWVLKDVESPQELFKDVFTLVESLDREFNLLEKVFEAVLEFAQDKQAISINDFVAKLTNKLSTLLSDETNVVKLIHLVANQMLPKHETKINKIVENIYERVQSNEDFVDQLISLIPSNLKMEINQYISNDDLKYFVQRIFGIPQFKTFVLSATSELLKDKDALNNAHTYNDLLKLLLSKLDLNNKGKDAFVAIVEDLTSDDKFKSIAKSTLTNVLATKFASVDNALLTHLSSDVVEGVVDLLKDLQIYDSLVNKLFEVLASLATQENVQLNSQLFQPLVDIVLNKFNENQQQFIHKIVSSNIWSNNKTALEDILKTLLNSLLKNNTVQSVIKNAIDSVTGDVESYLNKDALKALVDELVNVENVTPITDTLIHYLVNNNEWVNVFNDKNTLIYQVLKGSNVLVTNKAEINSLLQKILNSNNLDLVIQKAVNALLTKEGYNQTIDLSFAQGIKSALNELNSKDNDSTLVAKLIDLFANKLNSETSLQNALNATLKEFVSTARLSEFATVKAIINSNIFKSPNKEQAKNILEYFFNKYFNADNISKITALVPAQTIANASSYNDLVKIAFSQSEFTTSLKTNVVNILNEIVRDEHTREVLSNLITTFLNKESLKPFLKGINDKQRLVNNVLEVFDIFDNQLGISSIVYESLVDYLAENGVAFDNVSHLTNSIFDGLKASVSENTENKVTAIVRSLANSRLLTENKNDLITIFNNVFESISADDFANLVEGFLSENAKNELQKYLSINSFKELIKFIHSNEHFKGILNAVLKNSLDRFSEYSSVQSYSDIITKTFEIINVDNLETNIKGLIADLLETQQIKDILYEFFKTTLTTYEVNVTDTQIDNFIRALANNINILVDSIDILNPALDAIFNILKSDAFKLNPTDELGKISTTLTNLLKEKITNNPRSFADKILGWSFVSSNKEGLVKTLTQLLIGLNKQGVIANLINPAIDNLNINEGIFKYLAKDDIKALLTNVLKYPEINELINAGVPELINDTQWLDLLNTPETLIFSVFKKESILNALKTNLSSMLEKMLKESALHNSLVKAFDAFTDTYGLDLVNFNKEAFVKATANNLVNILKQANVYETLYNQLFESFNTSNNAAEFINNLSSASIEIFKSSHFNIVKALLNSEYLQNQKDQIKQLIQGVIYSFGAKSNEVEKLLTDLNLSATLEQYGLTASEAATATSELLKLSSVQNIITGALNHVLDNAQNIAQANTYNDLVKNIFASEEFKTSLKANIQISLSDIFNNDVLTNAVSKIIYKLAQDNNFGWVFEHITDPQSLIESLLDTVSALNEHFGLTNTVIDKAFEVLSQNGYQGDFSVIVSAIINQFSALFAGDNLESNVLSLFRVLSHSQAFVSKKADIKQLIENVLNHFSTEFDFGTFVWNKLPTATQEWINQNLFDSTVLINLINRGAKAPQLRELINHFIAFLVDNPNQIESSNTLLDLLKAYFNVEANTTYFKTKAKELITYTFSSEESQQAVKTAVGKFFTFLEVDKTTEIDNLINLLSTELVPMFNRIGLIDQVLDGIINLVKEEEGSIFEALPKLASKIVASIKPTQYDFFKKFIGDQTITNNKNIIKNGLHKIIESFVYRPGKLEAILNSLNVGSSIVDYDATTITNMIVRIVRDGNIMNVIKLLSASFVDSNTEYAKLNSWPQALNYFIQHADANLVKTYVRLWFQNTAGQNNSDLNQGVGAILHKMLKGYGFNFDNDADLSMMKQVANGLLKTLAADNNVLTKIVDKMVENIKSIDFTKVNDPAFALNRAITSAALSPLLSDDEQNILTSKIFDLTGFFNNVTSNIGPEAYTKFINRLFESSSLENVTGIYKFLNGFLDLQLSSIDQNASSNNSNSNNNQPNGDYKWNQPFAPTVKFDSYNIFTLKGKVSDFAALFFRPIFLKIYADAAANRWNSTNFKLNDGYKALYRVHTLLLWILHDKANVGGLFWNYTYDTVEAYVAYGQEKAWDTAYNKYKNQIRNDSNYLKTLGTRTSWTGRRSYWSVYTSGNDSGSTNNNNYWEDQVLAYIYYRTSQPRDKYNPSKTKTKVLLESLERGYIGASNRVRE